MTRKVSRNAARAMTNGNTFKQRATIVERQRIFINDKVGYDWADVLQYYATRLAYVHCGMLYIQQPEDNASKSTWDRLNTVLDMWGKQEFAYLIKRERGKFFNLGRMN